MLTRNFRKVRLLCSAGLVWLMAQSAMAATPEDPPAQSGADAGHPAHRTFDDPEQYASVWEKPERDEWQRPSDLVQALSVHPGMQVADIGSGTGYLLPYLSRAAGPGGRVYAVDISREMLAFIEKRSLRDKLTNVITVPATEAATGLPEGSLDRDLPAKMWTPID